MANISGSKRLKTASAKNAQRELDPGNARQETEVSGDAGLPPLDGDSSGGATGSTNNQQIGHSLNMASSGDPAGGEHAFGFHRFGSKEEGEDSPSALLPSSSSREQQSQASQSSPLGVNREDGVEGTSGYIGGEMDDAPQRSRLVACVDSLLCVFPKLQRLPWSTFFCLSIWCIIPAAGYIICFTSMGYGESIFYVLAENYGQYSTATFGVLAFCLITLYVFDAEKWNGPINSFILDVSLVITISGFVLLVLFIADDYPYGNVCLFAMFNPVWLLTIKMLVYRKIDTQVFVSWLSGPLFMVSVLCGLAWTIWVFWDDENEWNDVTRIEAAERTGCEPNYEEYPNCRKNENSDGTCFYFKEGSVVEIVFPDGCDRQCTAVYNDCLNGFILWVGPVLVTMVLFFLSFFCTFLRSEGTNERDILNFGKIWIFLIAAMWVTASLAGTEAGLTSSLAALTLASFVGSAMFFSVSYSKEERRENVQAVWERVENKYGKNLDVARGLFVVTCSPLIWVYFALSLLNQSIRRCSICPCSQPATNPEDHGQNATFVTVRTRKQIVAMKLWDRANVYTWAVYWGIAFLVLNVLVAKVTYLFLSWLIEATADLSLASLTAIMAVVGISMFLIPVVPGVPVYLTLGIVLPARGNEAFGWVGAIAYATGVSLVLKLFSSAMQQKLIGQNLSGYVKVRQFIGINSTLMKAMRLVLEKKGIGVSKVAILIGGPDWPTSVLCGIMRLELYQIMLGTIPIVFLILPTCMTGAFLYMKSLETDTGNPEFAWAGTVSAITASATAVVQFGAVIVAAYYLEQTANKKVAQVEAIPIDQEVKDADDRDAFHLKCYTDVTQWNVVHPVAKIMLRSSLACIVVSSYMVQLFSSKCFKPHGLTDTIDDNLDGKLSNFILPLGWVAITLFFASLIFLTFFKSWGERKAKQLARGTITAPEVRVGERE